MRQRNCFCLAPGQIAQDVDVRWDGVHVYQRGAKLIFETVATDLLRLGSYASTGG